MRKIFTRFAVATIAASSILPLASLAEAAPHTPGAVAKDYCRGHNQWESDGRNGREWSGHYYCQEGREWPGRAWPEWRHEENRNVFKEHNLLNNVLNIDIL